MRRVLITGANGFVGRQCCVAFRDSGWQVRGLVRNDWTACPAEDARAVGDLGTAILEPHLTGVDVVVHLAARAHRMEDGRGEAALSAYRDANVIVAGRVAAAAREAGVRRLVFVSSAKVFGEERDRPYRPDDPPSPSDAYARTKLEGEELVRETAGAMDVVILRPPMVYGPGGKGNVPRLIRLARLSTHVPLPFGAIRNRRSVVYVANLASALVHCATIDRAAGVQLVTDGEHPSTTELLMRIAGHLGSRARLFAMSPAILDRAMRMAGRGAEARRLLGSLVLDDSAFRATGWRQPYHLDDGLRATAEVVR